ncbi:MAG: hypothetical protein V3V28_02935 [Polaribacter sp.]|uniref:hypothetical protein n=1 Tax=Polaribacter sp. TaxID=1920175 RepID=UPI002F355096
MQLKHFFVLLLVLVLSVTDSTVYSQESVANYYQSSKVIQKKSISSRNTKQVVFNNTFSGNYFLSFFFPSIPQKNAFQKQVLYVLKLQKQLYQEISFLKKQHIFLITKTTSSNSISNLYLS